MPHEEFDPLVVFICSILVGFAFVILMLALIPTALIKHLLSCFKITKEEAELRAAVRYVKTHQNYHP